MSQVNLLPREAREKGKARNQAILVGIGGAAVVGLLVIVYMLWTVQLRQAESDVAGQKAVNAGLQGQVSQLMPYQTIQDDVQADQAIFAAAMQGQVAWAGILADMQYVTGQIGGLGLSTFNGTVIVPAATAATALAPATPATGETAGSTVIGNMTLEGQSEGTQRLARFLSKAAEVNGWGNPWMMSADRPDTASDRWDFAASIDLFQSAETPLGQGVQP